MVFESCLLVFSTPRRLILNRSGDMFPICLLAVFRKFWTLRGSIFQPLGVQFLEPVRTRFRMIQGVGLQRKFGKPRDDPHSNRPSARAERASESPPAIVQARRLATRDALASLAVLLLSMPLLLFFLFSAALPALASLAVLDALSPLALPVP